MPCYASQLVTRAMQAFGTPDSSWVSVLFQLPGTDFILYGIRQQYFNFSSNRFHQRNCSVRVVLPYGIEVVQKVGRCERSPFKP